MSEVYDFPVELQDLFTSDGKQSARKAVVRTDMNKIIGEVGANYKLVNHRPIFEKAEAFIKTFGTPTIKYTSINDGAKILGTYTFKEVTEEVKVGDRVGLVINAVNTHDGSQAVKLSLGGLRLTCLNGNSVMDAEFNASYRHTGKNIEGGQILDLVIPQPEMVMGAFQGAFKDWRQWAVQPLSKDDIGVFKQRAVEEGIITSKILTTPENLLEDYTAWGLYNQFTWQITHGEKDTASPINKMSRLNRVGKWFISNFSK